MSVSYPLPGTPFYERVQGAARARSRTGSTPNDLAMMYRATYAPEFYRALHALVHAEFRAQQGLGALRALGRAAVAAARQRGARACVAVRCTGAELPAAGAVTPTARERRR